MIQSIQKLFSFFGKREKIRWLQLVILTLIAAAVELLGIGIIFSFLSVLTNPENPQGAILSGVLSYFSIEGKRAILAWGGIAVAAIFLFKNAFLAVFAHIQGRFIYNRYATLSARVFAEYVKAPYSFFLRRNSADILEKVRTVISNVAAGGISVLTMVLTDVLIAGIIFIYLIISEPVVSLAAVGSVGGTVVLLYMYTRRIQRRNGENMVRYGAAINNSVQQGIIGIKEVKLFGAESYFQNYYAGSVRHYSDALKTSFVVAQYPRLVIEIAALGGLFVVALVVLATGKGIVDMIPILGMFAVAVLRLMPIVGRLSTSLASLKYYQPSIDTLYEELRVLEEEIENDRLRRNAQNSNAVPMNLTRSIEVNDLHFAYPSTDKPVLKGINLSIAKGTSIGFVGSSGAGKSTLIDIMLGLLTPDSGTITADGKPIHAHVQSWQRSIGYVPQSIFLSDASIKENIAFGLPPEKVDEHKLAKAIRMAQLESFVAELPAGADTPIGERGMRLSGGQRQRIAIARALYHDPEVLIFDEATAALDNETEHEITKAIEHLGGEKTILIVAHRLTTIEHCDLIYVLEAGKVTAQGKYQELLQSSATFQRLAQAGKKEQQPET